MHGPESNPDNDRQEATQQVVAEPPARRWTLSVTRQVIRFRALAVLSALLLFAIAYPLAQQMQMDRSIAAMFDPDDATLADYQQLQAAFGGNAVAILVYRDTKLLSPEGFDRSRDISQQVSSIPGVTEILSPAILSDLVAKIRPAGILTGFSRKTPPLMRKRDVVAVGIDRLFAGYTHSRDHSRAAVVAMLDPAHGPQTIDDIKAVGAALPQQYPGVVDNVALVGEPVLVHDGFALIERDGATLATWTVVLLSIVVVISLVDLRFVLLMAAIIVWSLTVTKAIMVLVGISLSLVSTIVTAIVTVIAVAAVLHLGVRFRIARTRGDDQRAATERSMSLLLMPILWTCATDAAGFAALQWSHILPVRHFGWMIAIASLCVFVAVLLFAPALMMLPNLSVGQRLHLWQRQLARHLRRGCLHVATWCVARRSLGVLIVIILVAISVVGVSKTETETSFLRNFRPDSQIVVHYDQVEQSFGGAGVWDIVIDAPQELTKEYLAKVLVMQRALREIDVDGVALTKVISLADAAEIVGRAPALKLLPPSVRLRGMRVVMPVFVDALLTPADAQKSQRRLRIMLRSREHLDAQQKRNLIAAVERTVREHTTDATFRELVAADGRAGDTANGAGQNPGQVTGYYVMMARLVSQLVQDQWRCFLASSLLIWVLLMLATRSIRLATAALLPNLLPVFFVLAVVGLTGGKINMGAAMIAAVSIGLSIDGSVHFLASYRRHRLAGHGADVSATHAAGNVGVPVLLATIALVIGFSVLATSEFVPTATFGFLVALTLAAGTVINLTLLPAFVSRVDQ
ncbi:MAG: MMPL family transporter [Pirellulaceae bacterium]|nr:MMPL family transporter [Pirellulaceae bacterium]